MPKALTKEIFITRAKEIHGTTYDYSKVVYKTTKTNVTLICKIHGEFLQTPGSHLNGAGCTICGYEKAAKKQTTERARTIIEDMTKKHNGKYDYSKFTYTHMKGVSTIICPTHGEFEQHPNRHLSCNGCPTCGQEARDSYHKENPAQGWKYSDWIAAGEKSKHFHGFKVYIAKLWKGEECFIKIGKTFLPTARRLQQGTGYKYEVLQEVIADGRTISELEMSMHRYYSEHSYVPSNKFEGASECYSLDILKDINEKTTNSSLIGRYFTSE